MRKMSDTIARLNAARRNSFSTGIERQPSRLAELTGFSVNPGALKGFSYAPAHLAKGSPLIVVLHGCTQTAAGYDIGAGWSQLADQGGFAVLYPEQQRPNNPNLCFNWFVPGDMRRDAGEPLSILSMVRAMIEQHELDPRRVFITGLSAGGAMASVMLATYPDVFAGGAIIAGLPYGCATSVPEALDRMRGHGLPPVADLQALLRKASDHAGPWPTISVWHGTRDLTVVPANMEAAIAQWRGVHGVGSTPTSSQKIGPHTHRVWSDGQGVARIEAFEIAGMAHGTPLHSADGIGSPGPFMLDAGLSSTRHIANFWGLIDLKSDSSTTLVPEHSTAPYNAAKAATARAEPARAATGVGKVIEDALRSAGLMR